MTGDLPPELDAPRERFIAELGERLGALRQSLARFASGSEPAGELNALRRRVHALAASAEVLRFTSAAEALASAEAGLAGAGGWDPGPQVRERVARILDLLPSLVLGAPLELASELDNPQLEPLREPLCVVVYADASLESLLHAPGLQRPGAASSIESHATRQPEQAVELVTQLSPDVLLVDGDDPELSELLPRLRQAFGARSPAVVAVGSFDRHQPLGRLMRRGVSRILPKPTDALTLQRTLRQVTQSESSAAARALQRRPSSEQLLEALEGETRRALGESAASVRAGSQPAASAALQAAAWGALARVRALATGQGQGAPSFSREGPSGALLLALDAPAADGDSRPTSAPVPLAGRRIVVADDDAAIRTLLSNALAELGATVLPARDGAEALDLAERHWPDALVSDTLMPGLDGFELCRRLRQDIALSDLPVLLVAWREHLLACTRGPATGRALEQLDGASLTLALRECLAPRVALEQRLAQHDAVHGRLDGLTPRLLLQMVCERSPNALLSLRSGRLTFEFSIADGRPVHARWYDGDSARGEGKCVLVPFLGIRAGRFSVEPLFSPPLALFEGDARAVLNPAAIRARRARELVSPRHLIEVARVALDPLAAEHYLAEFPVHAGLITQLGSGDALRRLGNLQAAGSSASGGPAPGGPVPSSPVPGGPTASELPTGDAGRLSAFLAELASRGVIGALLDRHGNDLLPGGPAFRPGSTPPGAARRSSRPAPAPLAASAQPAAPASAAPSAPPPRSASQPPPPPPFVSEPERPLADGAPALAAASDEHFFAPRAAPAPSELDLTPSPGKPEPPPSDQARASAAPARDGRSSSPPRAHPSVIVEPTAELDTAADALASAPAVASASEREGEGTAADELDAAWPPRRGARVRAAAGRALLALGAAAAAFLAIRALASRWERQNAQLPSATTTTAPLSGAASAGAAAAALSRYSTSPGAPPLTTSPAALSPARPSPARPSPARPSPAPSPGGPAPAAQPSAAPSTAAAGSGHASSSAVPVTFTSELLDLAPGTQLPPGQGLLEVHSWQRHQIYVDGAFMGNYENRLIPLGPGTYQLRLSNGVRSLEHTVEVKAGRRTRISARPSAAP